MAKFSRKETDEESSDIMGMSPEEIIVSALGGYGSAKLGEALAKSYYPPKQNLYNTIQDLYKSDAMNSLGDGKASGKPISNEGRMSKMDEKTYKNIVNSENKMQKVKFEKPTASPAEMDAVMKEYFRFKYGMPPSNGGSWYSQGPSRPVMSNSTYESLHKPINPKAIATNAPRVSVGDAIGRAAMAGGGAFTVQDMVDAANLASQSGRAPIVNPHGPGFFPGVSRQVEDYMMNEYYPRAAAASQAFGEGALNMGSIGLYNDAMTDQMPFTTFGRGVGSIADYINELLLRSGYSEPQMPSGSGFYRQGRAPGY